MLVNPFEETYQLIQMDGYNCLFTNLRLDRNLLPKGLHCYDVRDSDDLDGSFAQVKPFILVNHWGTILCKDEIPMNEYGCYYPEEGDVFLDKSISLTSFLELSREDSDKLFEEADLTVEPGADATLLAQYQNGYEYGSSFGDITVYPQFGLYQDNNLYLGLRYYDEEEGRTDFFGSITVNTDTLPYLHGTIDTNQNGEKILDFLEKNGFGKRTGRDIPSGFCKYPVFLFNEEAIQKHAPQVLEDYTRSHGQEVETMKKESLSNMIRSAETQASKSSYPLNKPERSERE